MKVPGTCWVNVVVGADVIRGAASTVRLKLWVASGVVPLIAEIVSGYTPPDVALGVPDSVPELDRVTPLGKAPVSVNVAAGKPVVANVKDPGVPAVNVALFSELNCGTVPTIRLKYCAASAPIPLVAVRTTGYTPDDPIGGVP